MPGVWGWLSYSRHHHHPLNKFSESGRAPRPRSERERPPAIGAGDGRTRSHVQDRGGGPPWGVGGEFAAAFSAWTASVRFILVACIARDA
jgi:hypothetical protein